jgi:DNA-binding NarL/FixJ family response regulator
VKVAIVEDETLLSSLLASMLGSEPSIDVVGTFSDAATAVSRIPNLAPNVITLDISLGRGKSGLELGKELRRSLPNVGIVLLTNHYGPFLPHIGLQPTGDAGEPFRGWSYLLKRSVTNLDTLVRAIQSAAAGLVVVDPELTRPREAKRPDGVGALSARQLEVLALIAEGYSNAGIASRLIVSEKSVENHVSRVFQQLGIHADRDRHVRVTAVRRYLQMMSPTAGD